MTKAQLIADLTGKLGDGFLLSTELAETVDSQDGNHEVKRYYVNYTSSGQDSKMGPIAQKRTQEFYVYDEGEAGETAFYKDAEFENQDEKAPGGSTLADKAGIFNDVNLRFRCGAAVSTAANDILAEAGTVDNHVNRVKLAGLAMVDPKKYTDAFMFAVANNGTIQTNGGSASDNDLQYVVNSSWDNVANAIV